MMSWLMPLGFLGLLGIAILILIYLLKPNYQQKIISSTFVWKLSLKKKKKKLPINRFRNILILICQILAITACAMILARPVVKAEAPQEYTEKIAVIDASAGMRTRFQGKTRFERAVEQVKTLAGETMTGTGLFSVIFADDDADFLVQRAGADTLAEVNERLDELISSGGVLNDLQCTYGNADIDGAMALAQTVVQENPEAEVFLYTGTDYIEHGRVNVVNVAEKEEWNAAILDCQAIVDENYYKFLIDVASYGRDTSLLVHCEVTGANNEKLNLMAEVPVNCENDETQRCEFYWKQDIGVGEEVYSFDSARIYIDEDDNYSLDNEMFIYGGRKPTLRMQYYSTAANTFFGSALMDYRDTLKDEWSIEVKQVMKGEPELEGFDFYLFEHTMPAVLPTDGVCLLVNPDKSPEGLEEIVLGQTIGGDMLLRNVESSPLGGYFTSDQTRVTQYRHINSYGSFTPIMYFIDSVFAGDEDAPLGDPALLVKNTANSKVAVLAFSMNYSDLSVKVDFPLFMLGIFDYFFPATLTDTMFEINESITLNARGPEIEFSGDGREELFTDLPYELPPIKAPGTYTVAQTPISGVPVIESFYVRVPALQSNICRTEEGLNAPYAPREKEEADRDLLLYFAAALVALLFIEWWLQSREQL